MRVVFEYSLIKDKFWMPKKIISSFKLEETRMDSLVAKFKSPVMGEENIFQKPFKEGTVYIYFKNYRINSGLSDKIFKTKN